MQVNPYIYIHNPHPHILKFNHIQFHFSWQQAVKLECHQEQSQVSWTAPQSIFVSLQLYLQYPKYIFITVIIYMRQFFNHAARCMWSALSKDTQGRIINHWRRRIAYSSWLLFHFCFFFFSLSIVNWGDFGSSVRIRYAAQSRWHLNMLQHAARPGFH